MRHQVQFQEEIQPGLKTLRLRDNHGDWPLAPRAPGNTAVIEAGSGEGMATRATQKG